MDPFDIKKNRPPPYKLTAVNFAEDSPNKIHSDDVAKVYGFKGGLVPGIAVYAYMTRPVIERLGVDWLHRGTITAKFIKPVYTGDRVTVQVEPAGSGENKLEIHLLNTAGTLCAVGSAGFTDPGVQIPDAREYPRRALPSTEQAIEARVANLPQGMPLGSLDFHLGFEEHESKVCNHYLDALPVYKGAEAIYHPAYLLEQANQILMHNLRLGPWLHKQSEVQNYSLPRVCNQLSIRGCVAGSFERRGLELVYLDLAIFDPEDHCIAGIRHTAIIRLK